jgi:integrase
MPKYKFDIKHILFDEDVEAMFKAANTPQERAAVSLLWITGARPGEVLEIRKQDVDVLPEKVRITIPTLKLGSKNKKFKVDKRTLEFERGDNKFLNYLIAYTLNLKNPTDRLIPYTKRWLELKINNLGKKALGKEISPYHFRHSVMTWLARKGATLDQLMYFKGARTLNSVAPYIHAIPTVIKLENLRRSKENL